MRVLILVAAIKVTHGERKYAGANNPRGDKELKEIDTILKFFDLQLVIVADNLIIFDTHL